jgi:DNA-binding NarL/FixJ family response regulator
LRLTYRVASDAIAPSQPVQVPLSPRELDIARLVAAGATNAEIADRLRISPKTVSAHLVNVFERLGIHKRAQLARYVTEHGLLE